LKKLIGFRLAGNILLVSLGLLFGFHILVLLRALPANIIWGGQVGSSHSRLVILEAIALVVTALFALIVAAREGYVKAGKYRGLVSVGIWIMFAFLILNTAGNLASGVTAEKLIFTPITLILAFCALRLAIR
jgi:hypothetical protein